VLTFFRFTLSSCAFIPCLFFVRQKKISQFLVPRSRSFWFWTIIAAVFMTGYNFLFFSGLRLGSAGQAGVLVTSMNPVMTFIIGLIVFRTMVSSRIWFGLFLGVVGGIIQVIMPLLGSAGMNSLQLLVFWGSACLYALLTLSGQQAQKYGHLFIFSFYLHLVASILALVPLIIEPERIFQFSFKTEIILHLLYISIAAGTVATTMYFHGTNKLGAGKASAFTFLIPVCALFLSLVLLQESPQWYSLVGGASALMAVWIIQKNRG